MRATCYFILLLFSCSVLLTNAQTVVDGRVVISEVYYDSYQEEWIANPGHHKGEFIELFNASCNPKNISGWTLSDVNSPAFFTFPPNTIIQGKSFVVYTYGLVSDPVRFEHIFPNAASYTSSIFYKTGPGALILNNKGEILLLKDNNGVVQDYVGFGGRSYAGITYNHAAVNGFNVNASPTIQTSIQRTSSNSYYHILDGPTQSEQYPVPLTEHNKAVNFQTRTVTPFAHPSPLDLAANQLGPCLASDPLIISQVYYDSYLQEGSSHLGEFIELYNTGETSLDLYDYVLQSHTNSWGYIFSDYQANSVSIPPKSYVILVAGIGDFDLTEYVLSGANDPAREEKLGKIFTLHPMLANQAKQQNNKIIFTDELALPDDKDVVVLMRYGGELVDYAGYGGAKFRNLDAWNLAAANANRNTEPVSNSRSRMGIMRKVNCFDKRSFADPAWYEAAMIHPLSQNNYFTNQNFIREETFSVPLTTEASLNNIARENKDATISYYDGLGRVKEVVMQNAAGSGRDLVTFHTYDKMGRENVEYMPYGTDADDGGYRPRMSAESTSFIRSEAGYFYTAPGDKIARTTKPFATTIFDEIPYPQPRKQGYFGEDWQASATVADLNDNSQKVMYSANVASDNVVRFVVSYGLQGDDYNDGSLQRTGNFEPFKLYKKTYYDNHGRTAADWKLIDFADEEGRILLRRENLNPGFADTYYVYDYYGQLCYVIQPEGAKMLVTDPGIPAAMLDKFAYCYKYDTRNRLVQKKFPGLDPEYSVYDNRNRLVMLQSGRQRALKQWYYYKYDKMNRIIMTGIYVHGTVITRDQMSALISTTSFAETYNGTTATHGYTNLIFPTVNADNSPLEVHSVSYYDTYAFKSMLPVTMNYLATEITGQEPTETIPARGQATASKVRVLGSQNFLWNVAYYDSRYRPVQLVTQNNKGGLDRLTDKYDLDKLLVEKVSHTVGSVTTTINKRIEYDHQARPLKLWYKVNNQTEILLAEVTYNELGQEITKKLYSEDGGATFMQAVDQRYTIRGWLERINKSSLTPDSPTDPADFFGMELTYQKTVPGLTNTPQWNGNVSALTYSVDRGMAAIKQHAYKFVYNASGQLTSSTFAQFQTTWSASTSFSEGNLEYDRNGNITRLVRRGKDNAALDNLTYTYDGNQLVNVSDTDDKQSGFIDGNNTDNDFQYDVNGALKADKNKLITDIQYNLMNQPIRVTKSTGERIDYVYDANGTKLNKKIYNGSGTLQKTIEYNGPFLYENNLLTQILHEEGRLVKEASTYVYQYDLKDHLGNSRVTFTTKPKTDVYKAGFEDAQLTAERNMFNPSYDNAIKINSSLYNNTNPGNKSQRLSAAGQADIIGLAKSLRVLPGDEVKIDVWAKYVERSTQTSTQVGSYILNAIAAAFGVSSSSTGEAGKVFQAFSDNFGIGLIIQPEDWEDEDAPKAFLNYMLFDENYQLYDFGFDQISTGAKETGSDVPHERLAVIANVTRPGYVFVYLSNEHDKIIDVYFDDLMIQHKNSPVIQSQEYYPFGLTFNNKLRENNLINKFLFSGKEQQDELGLNMYDFGARQYMADLGRWTTVDPMTEMGRKWSPYVYAFNNPMRFIDPEGMWPTTAEQDHQRSDEPDEPIIDEEGHIYRREEDGSLTLIDTTDDPYDLVFEQDGRVSIYDTDGNLLGQFLPEATISEKVSDDTKPDPGDSPPFGILTLTGAGLQYFSKEVAALKPVGKLGSDVGSSRISYYLSKWFSKQSPALSKLQNQLFKNAGKVFGKPAARAIVGGTGTVAGRIVGRWLTGGVNLLSLAMITYDVARIWGPAAQSGMDSYNAAYPIEKPGNLIHHICFVKGTLVYTTSGLRSIDQIKVGDSVYSYNTTKQLVERRQVVKTLENETVEIFELTTSSQKIRATAEHPLFVMDKDWVALKDLKPGDLLKTHSGTETVISLERIQAQVPVYNIEVEGNHNYFVSPTKILTHNKSVQLPQELQDE